MKKRNKEEKKNTYREVTSILSVTGTKQDKDHSK
jgi:hypothetical protein